MKVKLARDESEDFLYIVAECREDTEYLSRWDNCVLSSKFDHNYNKSPSNAALLIVKET